MTAKKNWVAYTVVVVSKLLQFLLFLIQPKFSSMIHAMFEVSAIIFIQSRFQNSGNGQYVKVGPLVPTLPNVIIQVIHDYTFHFNRFNKIIKANIFELSIILGQIFRSEKYNGLYRGLLAIRLHFFL